jgi:hexokinase
MVTHMHANSEPVTAQAFLKQHGMDVSDVDVDATLAAFLDEMEAGLEGRPSSLDMIPTFITPEGEVPQDTPVTVVDAGGTNLRVCSVSFNGEPRMENFAKHAMPGIGREITAAEFYETLCGYVASLVDRSDAIGFCFSYPVEIQPDRDGRLLRWTKEIQVPEVVGTLIGRGLCQALRAGGHGEPRIVLLNDTVATLLAGKAASGHKDYDGYVGLILGTGTNAAYVEKNSAIRKRDDLDPVGCQVINMESGSFAGGPRGDFDEALAATTAQPDQYWFEKTVSGAYLGPLSLVALKAAADEGVVGLAAAEQIRGVTTLTTPEMDRIATAGSLADGPFDTNAFTEAESRFSVDLCRRMIERAAVMTAVNISAAVIKSDSGRSADRPVCVTVDGTTFYKTWNFKILVERTLDQILGSRNRHYEIIQVDNAPVMGAAIAGLTSA